MSLVLQCKETTKPHPEGIHAAVCVDVIDLGLVESDFQGQRKMVNKVRLVFESDQKWEDGKNCTVSKNFTASLHLKAKLPEFLGKWRGRPVLPGETIDMAKVIGANCTLMISHQQNMAGRTYAAIDAVSKPTKRLVASGQYDPVAARQRIAEWKVKDAQGASHRSPVVGNQGGSVSPGNGRNEGAQGGNQLSVVSSQSQAAVASATRPASPAPGGGVPKSTAPTMAPVAAAEPPAFDPEVGF